jgi:hypothetical protein
LSWSARHASARIIKRAISSLAAITHDSWPGPCKHAAGEVEQPRLAWLLQEAASTTNRTSTSDLLHESLYRHADASSADCVVPGLPHLVRQARLRDVFADGPVAIPQEAVRLKQRHATAAVAGGCLWPNAAHELPQVHQRLLEACPGAQQAGVRQPASLCMDSSRQNDKVTLCAPGRASCGRIHL